MVAACHLSNRGALVQAKLVTDPASLKDIPAHQWRILNTLGVAGDNDPALETAELIVDALIGYGLMGNPRGPIAEWIARVNAAQRPVLALDTPSGLDTTTGIPGTPCIVATATLTLALPKVGLLTAAARPFVGELYLADISVPPALYRRLNLHMPPLFGSARRTNEKHTGFKVLVEEKTGRILGAHSGDWLPGESQQHHLR